MISNKSGFRILLLPPLLFAENREVPPCGPPGGAEKRSYCLLERRVPPSLPEPRSEPGLEYRISAEGKKAEIGVQNFPRLYNRIPKTAN